MFFNLALARRATAILALASLLSAPIISYAYDVPKYNDVPMDPVERGIHNLLPGNVIYPVERCGIAYTVCVYGADSPELAKEMRIRSAITLKQMQVDAAASEEPPNEARINGLLKELNKLIEELQEFFRSRPVPHSSDLCLVKYRQCLLEEYRNSPKEEGLG